VCKVQPTPKASPRQERRRQASDDLADPHYSSAVVPVRHVARAKDEQHRGAELDQPRQSEIEGAVRQRVDLPADSDGGYLVREL
jgi:hypothetical protein